MKMVATAATTRAMTTTRETIRHFGPPGRALLSAWAAELVDGAGSAKGPSCRGDWSAITVMSSKA
ncbi:hypothetical protein FYJ43_07100 [Cutibacterium sp. WCA-380-WT-3A]|uniref:Uncharacterized protein n=1 Tax=Cutibacterium porci TaxID=2605781 RepID=A0A7K0J768_9ACTN|nr:hypothetical protein [Cutibacterium porci]